MTNGFVDGLTLKLSKKRWLAALVTIVFFLFGAIYGRFANSLFYFAFRTAIVSACLFSLVVCFTALASNKYDLILNSDGLRFGSIYGIQYHKWIDIRATGIVRGISGERVFIELMTPIILRNGRSMSIRYLPDNYGMTAEELAKMLLQWRQEFGTMQSN